MNPRLLDMVKKGGNGSGRGKYNQRGRPNGGGMNDFRNRSQPYSNGQRQSNGGGFANGSGQRPTSRFSSAQNGNSTYQPRPYNGNTGSANQEQKPSYVPRSTTSNYPSKSGSYFDGSTANGTANQLRTNGEQPKYNGFQSKPNSIISNVYGQQSSHQSYAPVMQSGIPSLYNLPPPSLPFNTVQSVPFNYPPPVLPVKN